MSIKQIDFNKAEGLVKLPYEQLQDDASHHFCYFDIRNQQTLITESVLLFLSGVIFLLAIKKYYVIWKSISNRNKNANLAYLGILVWWFSIFLFIIQAISLKTFTALLFTLCILDALALIINSAGFPSSTSPLTGPMPSYYKLCSSSCLITGNPLF